MAITKSAKKAIRGSEKKRVFNTRRIRAVRSTEKDLRKLVEAGKIEEAQKQLSLAHKALDKAAKGNTIKKNNASRKKSRLAAVVRKGKEVK